MLTLKLTLENILDGPATDPISNIQPYYSGEMYLGRVKEII